MTVMRVAVQGCGHGNLNSIYERLARLNQGHNPVDLLIVCGDFQAIRNSLDLQSLAVPPKYRQAGDFPAYWRGERQAPVLTLFVGGNHEASGHLEELPYGGWVAPKMYYLGRSAVVNFGGLRIGGISGIYCEDDYRLGYYEEPPYRGRSLRSVYHLREWEVQKMLLLTTPSNQATLDIMVSHEWPHKIYEHGDLEGLLKCKPYFRADIQSGKGIGAPPLKTLLSHLRPRRWYAAHMHVEFHATVNHQATENGKERTEFLALDKCLPGRRHLRIFDIDVSSPSSSPSTSDNVKPILCYDPEWLAIIRAVNPFISFSLESSLLPPSEELQVRLEEARKWIAQQVTDLRIPTTHWLPSNIPGQRTTWKQTAEFCHLLGITDYWNKPPPLSPQEQ